MNKGFLTAILFLLVFSTWGQGWRNGEMEVRVFIDTPADLDILKKLAIDWELVSARDGTVRVYLVPDELKNLKTSKLRHQVIIADLNRHYENFWDNPLVPPGYYTYEQIISIADSLVTNFPMICNKISWGTSVGGRQLAVLKISDNVYDDEPEAEIMFDGGIHGDEVGGSQNIIMFARDLCLGYNSDPTITDLINNREIWLYLMVNPDGRASMSRYNNNGVDCNRDNGYMWDGEGFSPGAFSQVETKALRNGILSNQFVIYTNFHSGTEILSYPWSYRSAMTRDNAHIDQMASVYAASSGYSSLQYGQGYNIMYAINGSTKDFQYGSLGNIGWSMEISNLKQPPSSQISYYYNINKSAMLEVIDRCGWGLSGTVTDSVTGEPISASVWVNDLYPVYTDPVVGDYHKYVIPGNYSIRIMANGYQTKIISGITVPTQGAVTTNFQLSPEPSYCAFKVMSCRIPGNNFGDEGYTPGAIGKADSIPYSLGKNGWIVLDMKDTICDGPGADFKVIQKGSAKAFTVSGGNNMDGPFTNIGIGSGTTNFDIGPAQLSKIRYLHIKDNGVGPAYGTGVGFNLDAVEMINPPLIINFSSSTVDPCAGTTVNFTDQSVGNPTSWTWTFQGGNPSTSTLQHPVNIEYETPGIYNVTLSISNGITSSSKIKSGFITVLTAPVINLGNDTSICAGQSIVLDAGIPAATYLWSTGETTQSITADSSGTGYGSRDYWVSVSDGSECDGHDTIKVTYDDCTGLTGHDLTSWVSVFPNPAENQFLLDISGHDGGTWQLFSMDGIEVLMSDIASDHYVTTVNISAMPKGIYFLRVQKEGHIIVKKLIIL